VLLPCIAAVSATARIDVTEESWYSDVRSGRYPTASLTRFYAPMPVFFEGWRSIPRDQLISYEWDFGDGSPPVTGFNAAHVFEEPGTYTVTLTVRDTIGFSDTDTQQITVLARNENSTYYVDSELGSNSNDGRTPSRPWRTAEYAFEQGRDLGPGSQVLFRRGQTFSFTGEVGFGNWSTHGILFGAFGDGPKPMIQYEGGAPDGMMFKKLINGVAHLSFQDLRFDCQDPQSGRRALFWFSTGETHEILFHRVEVRNSMATWGFSHGYNDGRLGGIYLVECSSWNTDENPGAGGDPFILFMKAARVALIDNYFDYSANHVAYLSYVDKGVISGNTFSRPAFGRTGLRLNASTDFGSPTNNVVVQDNFLRGWVDPRTGRPEFSNGERFNFLVAQLSPNKKSPQSMEQVDFVENTVIDGEILLNIGSYEDLRVSRNVMASAKRDGSNMIDIGSVLEFDMRPSKNIEVTDNLMVMGEEATDRWSVFEVSRYTDQFFEGSRRHENITFRNNRVVNGRESTVATVESNDPAQIAEFDSDGNVIYAETGDDLFAIASSTKSLFEWQLDTGNDLSTALDVPQNLPVRPQALAPVVVEDGSIPISYRFNLLPKQALDTVTLYVKKNYGSWRDSGLSQPALVQGLFEYTPPGPGVYSFWVQTTDVLGNKSLPDRKSVV